MSDRSTTSLRVKTADSRVLRKIEFELESVVGGWYRITDEGDARLYQWFDIAVGTYGDIAQAIAEYEPHMAYQLWQDPFYDYSGVVWYHVPGHEDREYDCDANGSIILSQSTLDKVTDLEELDTLTGHSIRTAFNDYK